MLSLFLELFVVFDIGLDDIHRAGNADLRGIDAKIVVFRFAPDLVGIILIVTGTVLSASVLGMA